MGLNAENSKALQESLNEEKISQMLEVTLKDVFEKFNPSNAEIVVFALTVVRMMLQRAIETKSGYPSKMQIGTPTLHTIELLINKPSTDPLKQAQALISAPK